MTEAPDLSDVLVSYKELVFLGEITLVERADGDLRVAAYDMGKGRLRGGSGWITFEGAGEIESVDNRAPEWPCSLEKGMTITDLEYVAGKAWLKTYKLECHDQNPYTHGIPCKGVRVRRTGLRAALQRLFGIERPVGVRG